MWRHLRVVLDRLPRRNPLILAGDMNTQCSAMQGQVGNVQLHVTRPLDDDADMLMDLIRDFDLCLLNSWVRHAGVTFSSTDASSHIDHVYTRRQDADARARCAHTSSLDFFPWREGGKHYPVLADLRPVRRCHRPPAPPVPAWDQKAMIHDYLHNPEAVARFQTLFDQKLEQAQASVAGLQSAVLDSCLELYPKPAPEPGYRPAWCQKEGALSIKAMWNCYHAFRRPRVVTLKSILQVWQAQARFHASHRDMRKTGRRLRKAWRLNKLQEAEDASKTGRMHDLYAVVRQLAPKQVRRRVRLRGEDGALLDHHGEMHLLKDHCCTLFSSAEADGQAYDLTGLARHVTEEALLANMKRLPLRKVAPSGHVPAVAWKMTGKLGCQAIEALVQQLTSEVPKPWKDAWLAFIPKVATPKAPRDLRPIGLQDIDGKCVLGAVRDAVMPFILQYVEAWPQFAYVGQRSTRQAINRALQHCDFIRSSLQGSKLSLYDRRKGCVPARSVLGGIQVSVDMSQAFDRLDRTLLQAAMCDANIPFELQAAIMAWHQDMEYHLRHADLQGSVDSTVGVRQGCKIAPILWVLYTCYFFRTASDFLPKEWLQSSCTFFADDLHFCDVIAREADLDSFLHKAGKLFLHLQKFNMLINYKKSAVLMHLKGACTKRWRKHHVFHREGGQFLRIRVGEAIAFLPIKTTHKYLGIVLSYQAYEKATVLHRLAQSKAAFHRLRPVLTSKSTLNQQERLRVWQVCVLSCLRYGLDSIPLRQGLLKLIQVQCARQIRAITRSPVHLSRESTARLYARLHLPTELAHLRGIQVKQLPEAQRKQVQCESFCLEQMDWLLKVNAAYEQLQEPLPPVSSTVPDSASASTTALVPLPLATREQACPVCGLYFKDKTGVKIHMTRKHPESKEVPRPSYEQSRCGVDGMPTCAACCRPFSSWGALKHHAARCPVICTSILLGSLLAERDGGSQCEGDGSLLWQLPAGNCADGGLRESLQASPRDGGGVEGMELPEAQGQRQGQRAWEKWWPDAYCSRANGVLPLASISALRKTVWAVCSWFATQKGFCCLSCLIFTNSNLRNFACWRSVFAALAPQLSAKILKRLGAASNLVAPYWVLRL